MARKTRVLLAALFGVVLALWLLPGMATTAWAKAIPSEYDLVVGGERVTATNKDDILGDGSASFIPATDEAPNTLRLNGAKITKGSSLIELQAEVQENNVGIQWFNNGQPLTIELSGENSIGGEGIVIGIFSSQKITITGQGSITVGGIGRRSAGICSRDDLTVTGGASVTAEGDGENSIAIFANNDLTVTGGASVTAEGKGTDGEGIYAYRNLTVTGGASVTAKGSVGLTPEGCVVTIAEGTSLTATGSSYGAISGSVKNAVSGIGWTNAAGTEGETDIEVSEQGQVLSNYKKVQFPSTYTVTLTGGANATASGATKQTVKSGKPMDAVTYTADAGYHFEEFEPVTVSGVTASFQGGTVVVSGAPTANAEVKVPDAVADPVPVTHAVTLKGGANATASGATEQTVEDGKPMDAVTYTAKDGYHFEEFDPITVAGVTAELKDGTVVVSGTPTADAEVTVPDAVADPTPEPKPDPKPQPKTFPDVPEDAWFYGVVNRAAELGLFKGYNNGNFGPNDNVTRGQAAVVLWHMAGNPEPGTDAKQFPDVKAKMYYTDAIAWAAKAGVVNGYKNGNFGPDDNITREQLATMISNYARKVAGKDTTGSADDYKAMKDAAKVSEWAQSSVGWCFRNKILSGTNDGFVNPQGNATRAEAAKMTVFLYGLLQG